MGSDSRLERLTRAGWSGVVSLVLMVSSLAAQEPTITRLDRIGREMPFEHVAVRPDRPSMPVTALAQDQQGFLWVGSYEGLYRYDGYTSKSYRNIPEDPHSFAGGQVVDLLVDGSEVLWIATGLGLNRYLSDEERFETFRHDPHDPRSLSHNTVWCLLEDHAGALWVGTANGIVRFDRRSGRFTRFLEGNGEEGENFDVRALYEDRSHNLWAGTDQGLVRLDPRDGSFRQYRHDPEDPASLSNDTVMAVHDGGDGRLWVGTFDGLNLFDPETATAVRFLHAAEDPDSLGGDMVFHLLTDREGFLWIATYDSGVDRFHPETGTFEHFRPDPADPHSLRNITVFKTFEDAGGILWFATYNGLDKYDRQKERFQIFTQRTLGDTNAEAIWEDPSGLLWVGTDEGLNRIDRQRQTVVRYRPDPGRPGGLPHGMVTALWRERGKGSGRGFLWVGTWGGLCRFDERREFFHCYRNGPDDRQSPHDWVESLFEDRRGRLWVGTFRGLAIFDRDRELFVRMADQPSATGSLEWSRMEHEEFPSITEDPAGNLWFAAKDDGGLYRFSDHFELFRHDAENPHSLASNRAMAVHADQRGEIWVGFFDGGLDRLRPESGIFVHYREKDGLAGATVHGIREDDQGVLWLATFNGLSRFDPRTETFQNYDMGHGLAGNTLSMYSDFRGPSGEMFFGGTGGLSAFFPDRLALDPHVPPVSLTGFELFDQPAPLRRDDPDSPLERSIGGTRELVLSHEQNVFTIEYAAISYRRPERVRYAYQLEGFDHQWIEAGADRRSARYTNLDPADYRFRVKASNADGAWNEEEGASVAITVLPPPWRTWWAYTLYGLAVALTAMGLFWSYQHKVERERAISRRLRQVDKLKDEFLANTSHELRTPLYGITGLAESLIDGVTGELPEQTNANLSMIVSSGQRLSRLIDDILDYSQLTRWSLKLTRRPVELRPVADVVLTLSKPLTEGKELELVNAVAPDLPPADADEGRLEQILYNLIGNAIKFTESGKVEISTRTEANHLVVSVKDTGIGMAQDQQERIFSAFEQADSGVQRRFGGTGLGLTVTRQLVELHGGQIWVESAIGEGASFHFTLPVSTEVAAANERDEPLVSRRPAIEPDTASPSRSRQAPASSAGVGVQSILVVDDEAVNRQVLSNHLSSRDYQVESATNGPEALGLLQDRTFDLVVLDVMMPKMSGYEVCRELRRCYPMEELPVIFLTAKSRVGDLVTGLTAGGSDYLTKPISKDELLARVETHLSLSRIHRLLESRNADLASLNYSLAHDLKNPLTTIVNFVGILKHDVAMDRRSRLEENIRHIDDAAGTLLRQVEDLFELSRIDREESRPEMLALGELIPEVLEGLAEEIAERGVKVRVAATLPMVFVDRAQVQEMLRQLLANAVKFMGDAPAPRIEVGQKKDRSDVVFFVQDNGSGIDAAYHEKVFGLFDRLDPTLPGTGIGLTLARRIIEVQGGRIWVESEGAGRGSTLCFTLPDSGRPWEPTDPPRLERKSVWDVSTRT